MTDAISRADARRTETPNAVMTTLASPTQGTTSLAVWRVEMKAGKTGPDHAFDAEQVWTWLSGAATVSVDARAIDVREGDTLVIPAGVWRQVHTDAGFTAVVAAAGGSRVTTKDGRDPFVPPWIA
ncbi:cupin domain-containing protein [Microlunatus parietis]|uniref:Quercetin dioxygenase-like cupin family protein n=1 Tax=Microlunatus parietis TaxID=682979 RepID=A0A7Y9IDI3_9ACTN|nr:cupin domain-containing protein [Microlunatus parietis]NYE74814.1 quercetin dioxygenase-like cupin family protein [Microlunatus parietis]